MSSVPPALVTINPDEFHAEFVGRTEDGRQFFLTTPFVPATREDSGREFAAMYIFNLAGELLEHRIEDLGLRCQVITDKSQNYPNQFLAMLGKTTSEPIRIKPFHVEQFGITFGLIPRPDDEEPGFWWVEVEPGNYMAFTEPFDSGDYIT